MRSSRNLLPPVAAPRRWATALVLVLACCAPAAVAGETPAPGGGKARAAAAAHRVDVNRAGIEELDTLPGIGPALARRIVEYRRKSGPFRRVEDLLAVRGIGPRLLGKLRGRVTVGAAGTAAGGGAAR